MTAPLPMKCKVCGYTSTRSADLRFGDNCTNPGQIDCPGTYGEDRRPKAPGYINQSQGTEDGTPR